MGNRQAGFTLTELLVACLVFSIALTLGAGAFLHYWKVRALNGSVEEVVTELRGTQQDASTQTHPWVWGAWFKQGSPRWGTLRAHAVTGACEVKERRTLPAGVTIGTVSFEDVTAPAISSTCSSAAEAGAEVVLFFPRGTATAGSVGLLHPAVRGGSARTITVSPITGRVSRS